ncbi:hypothetical protein N7486_006328 [Penicillium sp. IBT 16267x]|nr:hypothetical protein N7486_006328 [Penicillium sp. IBT 16267x]
MRSFIAIAAFAAGTNALVGRSSCCFHLTASGGVSGSLGQLSDGQVRVGDDSLSAADFCINSSGAITDSEGRGCIITSETTQFQCDTGANATTGFSITSSGLLEYHNSPHFIACETGENGGRNIYTTNSTSVTMCKNVELTADSCSGSGSGAGASSSPKPSASASSIPVAPSSSPVAPAPSSSTPVYTSSVAPAPSSPAASSAPAPSAATLSGSPIYVTSTVTVTDCSCATTTPGFPAPSGGASPTSSVSAAPSYSQAPAPSGSSPSSSAQPSGPAGGFSTSASSSASSAAPTTSSMVAPSPSTTAIQSSASTTATQSSASSCATTLTSGQYQYPHLIIPINSSTPDTAYGTQYFGTVSETVSTLFNFDIPSSYEGSTCNLVFMFPEKADLETSDYTFSGNGMIDFSKLSEVASSSTTYDNAPSVSENLGDITISAGNSYVVSTFSCPAGETIAFEMSEAGTTDLYWFNDWNPSPLGLFITKC